MTGSENAAPKKQASRKAARATRTAFLGGISAEQRFDLEKSLASIVLPHLGPPAILGTYAATGGEIDPAQIEAAALALGWRLAWPRVTGAAPLSFHGGSYADLRPGFRGIAEPAPDAPACRPDVLLVPLLAADRTGTRLGQGAGHYDRTLAAFRSHGPLLAIGLAFDVQLVDSLLADLWDQPLDAIATPTAFHPAGPGAKRIG